VTRLVGVEDAGNFAWVPGQPGDAVSPGVGAEVGVKRAVLLHDHDHVADLVDPVGGGGVGLRGERARAQQEGKENGCTPQEVTLYRVATTTGEASSSWPRCTHVGNLPSV
jgi:hypothetical protein